MSSKEFREGREGGYNNLWYEAVLGLGASSSLVHGQEGSDWELVPSCARSAVADD